jgi:hypothetical protein
MAPRFGSYNRQGAESIRQSQPLRHTASASASASAAVATATAEPQFLMDRTATTVLDVWWEGRGGKPSV